MTVIPVHRPLSPVARILLCTQQPAPLYELLAAADDPSLEIGSAEIDTADSVATAIERLSLRPFDICLIDATWDASARRRSRAANSVVAPSTQVVRLSDTADEFGRSRPRADRSRLAGFAPARSSVDCCGRPCKRQSCSRKTDRSSGSCRREC